MTAESMAESEGRKRRKKDEADETTPKGKTNRRRESNAGDRSSSKTGRPNKPELVVYGKVFEQDGYWMSKSNIGDVIHASVSTTHRDQYRTLSV